MHKWLMEQGKCLKMEVEKRGIDNLTKDDLEEAYYYSKILCALMCLEKDGKIVEAMEKSENEDNMEMIEKFTDYPQKYYDEYRYSNGRFAPKGRGRRMYTEAVEPNYHMTPEMYKEHDPMYYRDMDRNTGKMYYTEPMRNGNYRMNDSKYENAKRMYTETKNMHNSGSVEDKQLTLKEGEKMVNVILDEIDEMLQDASPEMKSMVKSKTMARMQKIQ